jgi:hypothetical protein
MKNRELLADITPSTPTDFGGIGGTITAKEHGQLYDLDGAGVRAIDSICAGDVRGKNM